MSPQERSKFEQDKKRSRALDNELKKNHDKDQHIFKLLLLGAGESGKSTLFKQMITIYGKGFSESERRAYVPVIWSNIISSMKVLCQQGLFVFQIEIRVCFCLMV